MIIGHPGQHQKIKQNLKNSVLTQTKKNEESQAGIMTHSCNPSTGEAEPEELLQG